MKIIALARDHIKANPLFEKLSPNIELIWTESIDKLKQHKTAGACFDFRDDVISHIEDYSDFEGIPVFISDITHALDDFPGLSHVVKINLWPGFMQNSIIEACGSEDIREKAAEVLQALGWH